MNWEDSQRFSISLDHIKKCQNKYASEHVQSDLYLRATAPGLTQNGRVMTGPVVPGHAQRHELGSCVPPDIVGLWRLSSLGIAHVYWGCSIHWLSRYDCTLMLLLILKNRLPCIVLLHLPADVSVAFSQEWFSCSSSYCIFLTAAATQLLLTAAMCMWQTQKFRTQLYICK